MHEVGIVNGILDTVIRAARGAGASRAVLVTLRIGDMTEVVREALDFAWETFRDEDPHKAASLPWRESIHKASVWTAGRSLSMTASIAAVPNVAAPTCVCCTAASSTSQVSKSKPPTISPLAIW
mgnify:CR=1 FL=1